METTTDWIRGYAGESSVKVKRNRLALTGEYPFAYREAMARTMTNPGQLMLFGNPSQQRSAKRSAGKKVVSTKAAKPVKPRKARKSKPKTSAAVRPMVVHLHNTGASMSSKTSKKGKRRGKLSGAALAARNAKRARRAAARSASKPRKASRKRSARRARRARSKTVPASSGTAVRVVKVKRVRTFRARKNRRKSYGVVRVNPGGAFADDTGFLGGLRHAVDNVQVSAKGGLKGWAWLAAGAGGAVVVGSLAQSVTVPLAQRFLPVLVTNPILARVFAALNFYAVGWGGSMLVKDKMAKRGIMGGAALAAVLEIVKPGLIRSQFAKLPVVGDLFGAGLEGMEDNLGAWVDTTLSGLAGSRDDLETIGADDYSVGAYSGGDALDGLGCDVDSTPQMVTDGANW